MQNMSDMDKAPMDLYIKMHGALVANDYGIALNYCNAILSHEQNNATMMTFHELLTKKVEMMDEETDCTDTSSSNSDQTECDTDTDS